MHQKSPNSPTLSECMKAGPLTFQEYDPSPNNFSLLMTPDNSSPCGTSTQKTYDRTTQRKGQYQILLTSSAMQNCLLSTCTLMKYSYCNHNNIKICAKIARSV